MVRPDGSSGTIGNKRKHAEDFPPAPHRRTLSHTFVAGHGGSRMLFKL